MGIEYQTREVLDSAAAWSHGQFNYGGGLHGYSEPVADDRRHRADAAATRRCASNDCRKSDPNGFSYSGGANGVYASNINKTYDAKNYFATYFQDDWKMTPKLTLNLGLRWDYFGPINETNGGQANFVPTGTPARSERRRSLFRPPARPIGRCLPGTHDQSRKLRAIGCYGFAICLPQDGITLWQTDKYGKGLSADAEVQHFAPASASPTRSTRSWSYAAALALFYNSFENQGYGPNIGENYPFVFNLPTSRRPIQPIRAHPRRWRRSATTRRSRAARPLVRWNRVFRIRLLLHPARP